MLRFIEEILLLLIDTRRGDLFSLRPWTLSCTLAGALLMDLVEENRIDTDLERLVLLDATSLDNDLLDPVLADIAQIGEAHDVRFWVERIAGQGDELREKAFSRLVANGILEVESDGLFSLQPMVFHGRRYPLDHEGRDAVHVRLMRVLFGNDIPDPRDVRLFSLADACGVFERLLSPAQFVAVQEKIALFSRMFPLGRAIAEAIRQSEAPTDPGGIPAREIPVVRPPLISVMLGQAFMFQQYQKLGPIFQVKKTALVRLIEAAFITRPLAMRGKRDDGKLLVMAGPEANRFFSKNDKDLFRSHEFWIRFVEQFDAKATRATLTMSGEDHFRTRRVKRPGYSRGVGETQVCGILDVTRQEIASWSNDKPIVGTPMSHRLVYNLMCRVMAGISAPEYFEDFMALFEASFKAILGWYPSRLRWSRLRRARARMDELTAKIIALHEPENRGDRPPDVIDHVLALHRNDPQFLYETDLGITILEPIFAPVDTMAHSIAFMFYELLKDPDLLHQTRAEADALFAQGTPTVQGVQQLDVIKRAYMETLRLYSVVPATVRTVSNSFEFAGCTVAAGQQVILPFTLPHYLPEYFPNPERFDIDRFAPPRNEHRQSGVYMPYGLGTHRCLGEHLAEFMTKTAMATVLHDVDLALDPPDYVLTERKIKGMPTRHPNKSFRFRLLGRRSSNP